MCAIKKNHEDKMYPGMLRKNGLYSIVIPARYAVILLLLLLLKSTLNPPIASLQSKI